MSPMFHYYTSGDLFLLVHGADAPADEDWDRYADELARLDRSGRHAKILVLTEGGSPTGPQRARIQTASSDADRTAVVSSAAIPRFAVSLIALMHRNIRSFAPRELERAMDFVGLSGDERRDAVAHLRSLARERPMGLLTVLEEALAGAPA
jgi:hypothetical protein